MELTLFIIIGAVAIVAAAMMLISENAIYSALFLILNFACIAFFFLMLNAAFVAMVQIAVYAGAIMVLFLFVIMLLGAERVKPEAQPRFPWLTPMAIVLALIFLATTSVAIVKGEIDLTQPKVDEPMVRVVNAVDGVSALDVYLDKTRIADRVEFGAATSFEDWNTGRYEARVFRGGADPEADTPLAEYTVNLVPNAAISLAVVGTAQETEVVAVTEDLGQISDKDMLRIVAVNALHGRMAIDVVNDTDADNKRVLIDNLPYGAASKVTEIEQATYNIGIYPTGNLRTRLLGMDGENLEAHTSVLWIFTEQYQADNSYTAVTINLKTDTKPSFGSPTHVGQLLFSRYVLPFELVSLLLLVAMIGAIVLTHETLAPRRRFVRRLATLPAQVEQPVPGKTGD